MKYNILITEDEREIAELIKLYLENENYRVFCAEDGKEALEFLEQESIDMAILDIMMPGMDGYELTKQIRKRSNMPILILSAKTQSCDKIRGLNLGADDYMTKPFVPEELLARIRALSRRQGEVILEELTFDDLTLNLSSNDLSCKNKSIHLGYKEFEILKILMSNPKILISKETLIVKVWARNSTIWIRKSRSEPSAKSATGWKVRKHHDQKTASQICDHQHVPGCRDPLCGAWHVLFHPYTCFSC